MKVVRIKRGIMSWWYDKKKKKDDLIKIATDASDDSGILLAQF